MTMTEKMSKELSEEIAEPEMDYGFRFKEWDIYTDSRKFRGFVNGLLNGFPKEEQYRLVDQAKRALNSIVLNLAEGSNRNSDKDTRVYVNRAHTSLDEVVSCMDCALDDRYIDGKEHQQVLDKASSLAKRFRKFAAYLLRSHNQKSSSSS